MYYYFTLTALNQTTAQIDEADRTSEKRPRHTQQGTHFEGTQLPASRSYEALWGVAFHNFHLVTAVCMTDTWGRARAKAVTI